MRAGEEASAGAPATIDEPATVIAMHRYAEILEDLAPAASAAAAARARAEIARVGDLYDRMDALSRAAAQWDGETEDDEAGEGPAGSGPSDADAAGGLTGYFQALRATYEAVEDVQSQALARELQLIKQMREAGVIDAAHAKELRNDVYIQQLTLD